MLSDLSSRASSRLGHLLSLAMVLPGMVLATTKDVPSWVGEIASRVTPTYDGRVPAVVLFDEHHVIVNPSGAVTIVTRHATKILTHEGRSAAEGIEYYSKRGRQVKQLHAWLVAPNGVVKTLDKSGVEDLGYFNEMELYNEMHFRRVSVTNPELGAIFVYESEVEEKPLISQDQYDFQSNLPTIRARYVLTLPSGWSAVGIVLNHEPIQPVTEGSTYIWELKDLPYREKEQHAPSMRGSTPRLAVNYKAAGGSGFSSWADVSRWHSALAAGQDEPTPEMSTKVSELIANAKTEYAKINVIGHYVQTLRYVAIEMDLAHGGGYKPHTAEIVFQKQYGDCKDKANLMRAMLRIAGIHSYLVAAYSGDRTFVREEWPSPYQFNHMIVAVNVSDVTSSPTIVSRPIGRLLLFDPTDNSTPVGDLPWYEQGSLVLVCAGDKGELLRVPVTIPETNVTEQNIEASLDVSGAVAGVVSTVTRGQPASDERAKRAESTADQYKTLVEAQMNHQAHGISISKLETQDSFEQNRFSLKVEFTSRFYAQLMQQRLLVFSPSVIVPDVPEFAVNSQRTQPIILRAGIHRKNVHIKLPTGFSVDEMPLPFKLESDFGKISLTYRQEPGELIMVEEVRTEGVTLPASQYANVKKFFDEFCGADNQNAVLVRN